MMWDPVGRAMAAAVAALPDIIAVYGANVRLAASGALRVVPPLLEYRLIADTEMEQWEPIVVQWEQWTDTYDELVRGERALRQLLHREEELWLGGIMVLSKVLDGAELADPDRQGFFGRAVRFRLVPIAGQYVVPEDIHS